MRVCSPTLAVGAVCLAPFPPSGIPRRLEFGAVWNLAPFGNSCPLGFRALKAVRPYLSRTLARVGESGVHRRCVEEIRPHARIADRPFVRTHGLSGALPRRGVLQ